MGWETVNEGKGGVKEGGGGNINGRNKRARRTLIFTLGRILETT